MMDFSHKTSIDVMHVIGATAAGGAERFVVDLSIELVESGRSVVVFALSSRVDDVGVSMREKLGAAGVRFFSGPTRKVGFTSVLAYRQVLRQTSPQIVHLHTPNTELAHAFAMLLTRRSFDIVRTVHNTAVPETALLRWAYLRNKAARSFGCGKAAAVSHTGWLGTEVLEIKNGILFEWPVQSPELKIENKGALGLQSGNMDVVVIGSMRGDDLETSQKAFDTLIHAWKIANNKNDNRQLHLIGDGELRDQLENLAGDDRSILFHGIQANIPQWLLAADIFVMPSRYEGLPVAAIEAIGTGIPCIFSDIEPLRELSPSVAVWSEPGNPEQLAERFAEFFQSLPLVDREATARFRKMYAIENVAMIYAGQYDSIRR